MDKWDKTGNIISGFYKGVSYAGKVVKSRKAYGDDIIHTIELFEPITVDGTLLQIIDVNGLLSTPYTNYYQSQHEV